MASKITKRLEIATQTTGAAQAERDLAKLGQAAATAGEVGERGLNKLAAGADKAGDAVEEASGGITGALDGIGKKFEATDKASEVLGKITGAFGLVTAAAGLAYGAFELVASTMQSGEAVMDRGVVKWNALRDSISGASEALAEYVDLADPRVLQRLTELKKVITGEGLPVQQQAQALQLQVAALRDEANRILNVVGPGPRYEMELKKLRLAEENLRARQEDIAAAMAESKALSEDAKKEAMASFGLGEEATEAVEKEIAKSVARTKAAVVKGREDIAAFVASLGPLNVPLAEAIGLAAPEEEGGGMLSSLAAAFSPLRDEIVETVDVAVEAYDDIQASMDATSASAEAMGEALRNGAEAYASVAIGAAMAGESISAAVGAAMKAEALQYAAKAIGYAAEALFFSIWDPPAAAAAWAASAQAGAAAVLFGAGAGVLGAAGGGGGGGGAASAPVSSESLTGPRESGGGGGDIVINANFQGQPLLTDRAVAEAIGRGVSEANRQRGNAIYGRLS